MVCAAAQTLSQMGGVNVDDLKLFSMPRDHPVLPHTDLAPASTAECAIAHNMPHRKAVNTLTQAASPMRPATTFAHVNNSMAVDWHATSGHTFSIDGGTMPPFLR